MLFRQSYDRGSERSRRPTSGLHCLQFVLFMLFVVFCLHSLR